MTNQLEIVVVDKQRTTVATEVALPNDMKPCRLMAVLHTSSTTEFLFHTAARSCLGNIDVSFP